MIAKYRGEIFQKPAVIVLSAMICTALWGSAGPFIKLAYQFLAIPINNNLDKSLLAGIRFTLSGIVVLVLSLLRRRTIQSPPRRLYWIQLHDRHKGDPVLFHQLFLCCPSQPSPI